MITNSSYMVFDECPTKDSGVWQTGGGVSGKAKFVTFYTRDGSPLATIPNDFMFPRFQKMLDHDGGTPVIASYRRVYWPAIGLGFGLRKGVAGYAVYYHDKNGYRIACRRIEHPYASIPDHGLDLSQAVEEPSDFSRAPNSSVP